jgi:phosphatidate cytidylyltransferase
VSTEPNEPKKPPAPDTESAEDPKESPADEEGSVDEPPADEQVPPAEEDAGPEDGGSPEPPPPSGASDEKVLGMDPGTATRLAAGLGGLAVLLPLILFGGIYAVQAIVGAVLFICVTEYATMAFPDDRPVAMGWLGVGVAAAFLAVVIAPGTHHKSTVLGLYTVATLIFVTLRPGETLDRAADITARYALGVAWMGLLLFLVRLRALDHGLAWCFVVLGISWLGDTGAYFAGRAFGKRKLYERISPKKSVEGAVGGVITATLGVFLLTAIGMPGELTVVDCLVLGIVGCIIGVLGDLGESMLKRSFGVKDAGSILPGHGGLLDRIDSVLFVGAFVYGYATLVKG